VAVRPPFLKRDFNMNLKKKKKLKFGAIMEWDDIHFSLEEVELVERMFSHMRRYERQLSGIFVSHVIIVKQLKEDDAELRYLFDNDYRLFDKAFNEAFNEMTIELRER
jgi:hypothetical protein